jgi:hypothetical protein
MSGYIPPLPQYVFMAWCSVKRKEAKSISKFKSSIFNSVCNIEDKKKYIETYKILSLYLINYDAIETNVERW